MLGSSEGRKQFRISKVDQIFSSPEGWIPGRLGAASVCAGVQLSGGQACDLLKASLFSIWTLTMDQKTTLRAEHFTGDTHAPALFVQLSNHLITRERSAVDNVHHQIQVWSFSWSSQQTSEQRKRKVISLTQMWPWCDGVFFFENLLGFSTHYSLRGDQCGKTKTRGQWAAAPWTEIPRWWESLWQLLRADEHQDEKKHRAATGVHNLNYSYTFLNYACFSIWLLDWRGRLATLVLSLNRECIEIDCSI